MEHHIKNQAGDTIASFEHACDADVCHDAFMDFFGRSTGCTKI